MHEPSRTGPALAALTALTLLAFAANSLLCRAALDVHGMDAASFTLLRLGAGAVVLGGLVVARGRGRSLARGGWTSAVVLLVYALCFSLAYRSIPTGVGALVMFAAVQLTMLAVAVRAGEGPNGLGWCGIVLAVAGLAVLTLPGAGAPDPLGVLLMTGSGVAWGIYSLRGRGAARPVEETAATFVRCVALALPACAALAAWRPLAASPAGALLAVVSGAVTSGLGYVVWYTVLPALGTTRASVLQLAVPVLAAAAGVALLGERPTVRLAVAALAILGGILLVLRQRIQPGSCVKRAS